MFRVLVTCFIILDFTNSDIVNNKFVYNDNNKVTFSPAKPAEYFGYSVFLTETADKLIVGAPKANSTRYPSVRSGRVFTCPIEHDVFSSHNATCDNLIAHDPRFDSRKFLKDDMFFGATVGAVNDKIIIACAPSWAEPYRDTHLLSIGACYAYTTTRRNQFLYPLKGNEAFGSNGARKEYDEYGGRVLNYYAYGLAGMSMKVTDDSNILLGAPGILHNTGGIVDYYILERGPTIRKQPIANPYFTFDLGPDDYFGYSVESAKFEPNGKFLQVGGAPRSKLGLGQVLIIEPVILESNPLKIKSKIVGPQVGSYFGAALSCVDINGDGRIDLLVGAPNYVEKGHWLNYDQGAVFVYLNREKFQHGSHLEELDIVDNSTFLLEEASYVLGTETSRARFGSAIASLGDIDGDGYNDVAIGAPWEDFGAVYVYQGSKDGLKRNYLQRITAEGARGFGFSISKGQDVDKNYCNDVAIGAFASGTVYLYKCTPSIKVDVSIKLQDIAEVPENATSFTAYFCLTVRPQLYQHLKLELQAIKTIDPEANRATILEDTSTVVSLKPGIEACDEHEVFVNTTTDLTKPIHIEYELKLVTPQDTVRLSEDSVLKASSLFQMIGDCGKDLICTPLLTLTMEPFESVYIPGTNHKLGAKVTVTNLEEPAYGVKFNLTLPLTPKRVPTSCELQDLNMTCHLPPLFRRNETATFDVELEYAYLGNYTNLTITADMRFRENITTQKLELHVHPVANITVNGKSLPNVTVEVSREALYGAGNVSFVHYYQINNLGPSDWYNLKAFIFIADKINLSRPVAGCVTEPDTSIMHCEWSIPAKHTLSVVLPLRLDLQKYGEFMKENITYNATSMFHIRSFEQTAMVITSLVLDPAPPLWPIIVAVVSGFLLLVLIVLVLYKFGFFSRPKKEDLKRLLEDKAAESEPSITDQGCTSSAPESATESSPMPTAVDSNSTRDLIDIDSD